MHTVSDTGKYWCGVERFGVDTYIEVNLNVKEAPLQTTVVPTTSTVSLDVSTTWTYAPTTNATETMSSPSPEDPASRWLTEALLYAALGATGLIVLLVLVVCVRKCRPKRKPQAVDPGCAESNSASENDYDDIGLVLRPVAHVPSGITRHHNPKQYQCRSPYILASWSKNGASAQSSSSSFPSSTRKHHPESAPPPIVPRGPIDDYANLPSTPANKTRPRYSFQSKVSTWESKDLRAVPVAVGRREKS
ncbi:uncharacterized protein LOC128754722 [Synchiropus splendidus]|uniref:uncharacterized protein LOC128754722 n=1 Tax=Synchiropus splendidus TaxID=270530 RepID=UPI00237E22E0|nr:uncharacterized protein LOC128754722 [Synchiropus splendidus]